MSRAGQMVPVVNTNTVSTFHFIIPLSVQNNSSQIVTTVHTPRGVVSVIGDDSHTSRNRPIDEEYISQDTLQAIQNMYKNEWLKLTVLEKYDDLWVRVDDCYQQSTNQACLLLSVKNQHEQIVARLTLYTTDLLYGRTQSLFLPCNMELQAQFSGYQAVLDEQGCMVEFHVECNLVSIAEDFSSEPDPCIVL